MALQFTRKMIDEYVRCSTDIAYFAENYVKLSGGKLIVLNSFQKSAIGRFKDENSFVQYAARQVGKTTVAAIIILHQAIFNDNKTLAIMSHQALINNGMIRMIDNMLCQLPDFLRPITTSSTKRNIGLETGSRIILVYSNDKCSLRGFDVDMLYIDEIDFIPSVFEILDELRCRSVCVGFKKFAFTTSKLEYYFSAERN